MQRRIKRRIRIPAKLAIAASPLVIAVGGLLAITVRTSLDEADQQARAAQVVGTWSPINAVIDAVDDERGKAGMTDSDGSNVLATDAAIVELTTAVAELGDPPQLVAELTQVTSGIADARDARSIGDLAATLEYDQVMSDLSQLGDLLPAMTADAELGRDLQALAALQRARQGIGEVSTIIAAGVKGQPLEAFGFSLLIESNRDAVSSFVGSAPLEWLQAWNDSTVPTTIGTSQDQYLTIALADPADVPGLLARTKLTQYKQASRKISTLFEGFTVDLTSETLDREAAARTTSRNTVIASSLAVLLAVLVAWRVTRSITRRIRKVSAHAHDVSVTQLPTLVEALRDPRGRSALPQSKLIEGAGRDEVGELADSFNAMQTTLVGVAEEQMAVLRRGVSDIFVTLARRNRSLVDRQLALLDTLESDVDDPKVLGDYFKLDHLATRMRRNAESLLVLAHTETRHRRADPVGIDDVVRAAISEVEEYQRIDVLSMEPMTLRGLAVADMSHMLAELIDNAASFSPPHTSVRVTGHMDVDGYVVSITDQGMGTSPDRLDDLNELLATPPVIGLSVEPTLGLSVVSLLAHKHGVLVRLASASPGISVTVRVPASMFEPVAPLTPAPPQEIATYTAPETVSAPLRMTAEDRLAAELAITTPTPTPRLRRLEEGPAIEPAIVVDESVTAELTSAPSAIAVAVDAGTSPVAGPEPLPVRRPPGGQLPVRPVSAPPVASAPALPAEAPPTVSTAAHTSAAQTPAVHTSAVHTAVDATRSIDGTRSVDSAPVSMPAHGATQGGPVSSSSPAGSSPNDVRDPAAMLNLGRPLLEGRATAAGLPMRTPGNARPNVGGDERSVGVSQPEQVRANLAAFARGVTAANTGASLDDRVAAERAALAARSPLARVPLTPRPDESRPGTPPHNPSTASQVPADVASAERTF